VELGRLAGASWAVVPERLSRAAVQDGRSAHGVVGEVEQRAVEVGERISLHVGAHADAGGLGEEFTAVGAGVVAVREHEDLLGRARAPENKLAAALARGGQFYVSAAPQEGARTKRGSNRIDLRTRTGLPWARRRRLRVVRLTGVRELGGLARVSALDDRPAITGCATRCLLEILVREFLVLLVNHDFLLELGSGENDRSTRARTTCSLLVGKKLAVLPQSDNRRAEDPAVFSLSGV
jgi:hypothetical protein